MNKAIRPIDLKLGIIFERPLEIQAITNAAAVVMLLPSIILILEPLPNKQMTKGV